MDAIAVAQAQDSATREASQIFPGLVGHREAARRLGRSIELGQLHHALLVGGAAGVGKGTLARGLGCALLCDVAPGRGCGECSVCARVLADRHPDVRFLIGDAANGALKADAARTAALESMHAPYEGRAHLIVLPHADRLGPAAANALLKAIEEPNPAVYWMLLSESPRAVLPTLRSRSFEYELGSLTQAEVAQVLSRHQERLAEVDPDRLELAITLAEGSAGRAMDLAVDASVPALIKFTGACLDAIKRGSKPIFSGPKGELWSAMDDALAAFAEHAASEAQQAVVETDAVIRVSGKGKAPAKSKSSAKGKSRGKSGDADGDSAASGKPGPAVQRAVLGEMCRIALFHLQRTRHGHAGVAQLAALGPRQTTANELVSKCMRELLELIPRNPNVRLALEATLLRAHHAVRMEASRSASARPNPSRQAGRPTSAQASE